MPPRPSTPSSHRPYDVTDRTEIEIEVFESEPHKFKSKTKSQESQTTTHRKSVSFDLSDNEYIPVLSHDEPTDNIGELFLRQFSRENSHEDNDGYEIPIKYPNGPKSKTPKHVKSILRSPSPSSKASAPSSLDRPLRTTHNPSASIASVTTAIVHATTHSSDEEIERENPFRKEFLGRRAENIYEELDFEEQTPVHTVQIELIETNEKRNDSMETMRDPKQRPKSTYESREYSEMMSKMHQSNDDLRENFETALPSQVTSRSIGSLPNDRPKQKPPLPPKPTKSSSSVKSPPAVIKQADLKKNEALKFFQEEMLRGDLYEFVHDAETNQIKKIKQQATSIPIAIAKQPEPVVEEKTKESPRLTTFNPSSPLPPIPKTKAMTPPYSRVFKHGSSVERPTVSPPPPPVNLLTMPSSDKLKPIQTEDGSRVEILSTSTEELRKLHREQFNENAAEYSLVTEETHREILLKENEMRNALQQEQSTIVTETVASSSRIPVRKAPLPPSQKPYQNISIASDVSQEHSSSSHVFPVTQILPVQYSHLPTPQQPDYFLTFPSSPQPSCNVMQMPQPGAFSTFMVSDNSAPQTTNNPTNIVYHPQQVPMYLQRSYIPVPISTIHNINQVEHKLQGHNFINIHGSAGVPPANTSSGHIFDVYRSNYNQQQQQQHQQHHYHYQTQSLLPGQQDIHSTFSPQSTVLDSNPNRNEHSRTRADDNVACNIGSSALPSITVIDSQFTRNRNINENDNPVSSAVAQSSTSLTSISNNQSQTEEIHLEHEHTFTTFGKQTQV